MKYAIIDKQMIHHEGDERSRTHPGHGYPAYSEEVLSFQSFGTLEELKKSVESRSRYGGFKGMAIEYRELPVRTRIEIGGDA